ncbi:hypothetical protein KJ980_08895 [Patescibacteria group bacterium]|nr:hypothetical protein [Patescibacteria group bacterium]
MNNKIIIESLSMDLLRVARGYHRGSNKMAKRFSEEALKRVKEIDSNEIKPYFVRILNKLPTALSNDDVSRISEDALMYSTLCKNYTKHYC